MVASVQMNSTMKTSLILPIWVRWFFEVCLCVRSFITPDLPSIEVLQIDRYSGEQLRQLIVESDFSHYSLTDRCEL